MTHITPFYKENVKGSLLKEGDIIICNQAYGTIFSVSPDEIITSTGHRKFYPDHSYPTFTYDPLFDLKDRESPL